MEFNPNDKLDFSYPEGFKKAASSLTFLSEEQREVMLGIFLTILTQL